MRIGIIGAGRVGGTLGRRWAQHGHEVLFGVRHPDAEKTRDLLAAAGPNARASSPVEAARFGEVVVLAVPAGALASLSDLGDLPGKVVVDCVNRLGPQDPGMISVSETIAALLPGARVVKAFNTMGAEIMADPQFGGIAASNFICGDDDAARAIVADLSRDLGFDVVDAGPLAGAPLLESLARLWIDLAFVRGMGRRFAFTLLRR